MATSMTAMNLTPGVTVCTKDGTPYRPDWSGIVHVQTGAHVTELTARGATTATTADIHASFHKGASLVITVG